MIIAATGHRPEKLGGHGQQVRLALGGLATEYLARNAPDQVISGMALGWDQAVAASAILLGIPLVAAIPFSGHQCLWPDESIERWQWLIDQAAEVVIVTKHHDMAYSSHMRNEAYQRRNEWMVDRANKIGALWDGSWGGTFNCIQYATKKKVPVENLWQRWSLPEDVRDLLG